MTSSHGKGVRQQVHLSIMLLAILATSMETCYGVPWTAHSSSIFSSGGYLVQWSRTVLAILVKGHKRNTVKPVKTEHLWDRIFCSE